jgi:hypothetical protein
MSAKPLTDFEREVLDCIDRGGEPYKLRRLSRHVTGAIGRLRKRGYVVNEALEITETGSAALRSEKETSK